MSNENFNSILTGSFSTPSGGNPTVRIMEAGYHAAGIDARYINCDVKPEDLENAVKGAKAQGWTGFNCSIPHKLKVIQYLDDLAESARLIGAVNCINIKDGKLIGNNTDGQGFLASLRSVADPEKKRVLVMGSGGAARAICVELALAGAAHLIIYNKGIEPANDIVNIVTKNTKCTAEAHDWVETIKVPEGVDIVVNATSVGFGDAEAIGDVDVNTIKKEHIVADVIPNPPNTKFLREASARGATTLQGLGMLVNQGAIGAKIWLGKDLDTGVMKKTLVDIFGA